MHCLDLRYDLNNKSLSGRSFRASYIRSNGIKPYLWRCGVQTSRVLIFENVYINLSRNDPSVLIKRIAPQLFFLIIELGNIVTGKQMSVSASSAV
jgi:hypothetical protein